MRHLLILCYAIATAFSAETARAQRTLSEEQTSSLLQYLPPYFGSSKVWQVMRVDEAYDWQPPGTVNAYVLFRSQSAGLRECLAPVFAFAGVSDARGVTNWQVASDVAAQHYFWAEQESCANVALDDGALLRTPIDSIALRTIRERIGELVAAGQAERQCSIPASLVRVREVDLDVDGRNGTFYRAMLEVGECGWLGVEFHLHGNATEIIDASWVVD
jgi:hypothetical protein